MKGIILAGGSGTRLYPVTRAVNKHLLPIYNKPMIYYPLSLLMLAQIRDVLIICNPGDERAFEALLGKGEPLGMEIKYQIQPEPRGLAEGLILGEEFAAGDSLCLILGDNIFFGHDLPRLLQEARQEVEEEGGAIIFGYFVRDPERFGIIEFDEQGQVLSLEEKPLRPRSNLAAVGLYFYDPLAPSLAKKIQPSARGELEITSVNEEYLRAKRLKVKLLGRGFAWFDAGTHDSFLEAGEFVATIERRTGLMIGCVEEIAYRNGWIDAQQLLKLARPLEKTDYGKYLLGLLDQKSFSEKV